MDHSHTCTPSRQSPQDPKTFRIVLRANSPTLDEGASPSTLPHMTARAEQTVAAALRLDRDARAELTRKLILSLEEGPRDRRAGAAWLKEVARRRKEIAAGRDVLLSHEDMMREAWARLHAARRHAS